MRRLLLGMLTLSSNTALGPLTSAMLASLPEVPADLGRFRVTEISLKPQAPGQFDSAPILEAARLLATRMSTWSHGTALRQAGSVSTLT